MARSIFNFSYQNFQETDRAIKDLLSSKGFKLRNENGETVWKKGSEFWTGAKVIKLEFSENRISVSAWISNGFSEMQLTGFVGAIPKKQLLNIIEEIKYTIR